ncbi:MAG TPA: hypothetical protein VNT79_11345, partial [Phycisphaerae bacterium]|nr:hypothetical protein [Phycisphaerae bacterium]
MLGKELNGGCPVGQKFALPKCAALLWVTGLAMAGCGGRQSIVREGPAVEPAAASTAAPAYRGTLVMIPGITGDAEGLMPVRDGLCDAGCGMNIEIVAWESSRHPIRNLTDLKANTARARRIADRLTRLYREHPGKPLVLLGNSGGGGLAVLAMEMLPKDVIIDRLILTAAAVSNDYDLAKASAHCGSIVNIFSRSDVIVGLGTSLFGTIDRKKMRSAGYCGFLASDGALRKD